MSGTMQPPVGVTPPSPTLTGLGSSQLAAVGLPTPNSAMNINDLYAHALGTAIMKQPGALQHLFGPPPAADPTPPNPNGSGGGEGGGADGGGV